MKKFFKKITRQFTGAALASVMVLSGSLPAYGGDNENTITSSDDVVDPGSSGGSDYDYTNVDPYGDMINILIETGKTPYIEYKEFCEPGGTYYEPGVTLQHKEIPGSAWSENGVIPFRPYVTEIKLGGDWKRYEDIVNTTMPGEGVDTIRVVDLSHSDESYTEEGYRIFRPDLGIHTINHYIEVPTYKEGWDNGGTMDIYIPWFDEKRRDTVTYTKPFEKYCEKTEETIVIDSKTALLEVEKNCVQVEGRTGRFQAELTDARTGKFITAETLVLEDPNGTPTVTFSGLPDGQYKVTWSAEHTARWYTWQRWYTEIFGYVKETRRAVLAYTSYWERKDDWEYSNSYWVEDEIESYTFNSRDGGDITIGDGGEVSNWVFIK